MNDSKPSNEIAVVEQKEQGLAVLGPKADLENRMTVYHEAKEIIVKYIDKNFTKGVDFGWTDERAKDKMTLKKPGAEKICRLFNTSPVWENDWDTWKMLGEPAGIICYICYIVDNKTGNKVGQGRGAEKLGNKGRDANKAIKNAEKTSLVDACLYTFMMSEKFTQDEGGKTTLTVLKELLQGDISELRMGQEGDMKDLQWLKAVLASELHKGYIETVNEHAHIRKVIFEENKYNLSTGEKI